MKRLIFSTDYRTLSAEDEQGQLTILVAGCTVARALAEGQKRSLDVFADTGDGRDLVKLNHNEGTPQNFDQALAAMLNVKPGAGFQNRLRDVWKDYVAQKFSVAMLQAPSKDEADRLQELFNKIVL